VIATFVAVPLPMIPLTVLAFVLLPFRVRTVPPAAPPTMPPPKFKVAAPDPAPLVLLLVKL